MRKVLAFVLSVAANWSFAQELNCKVTINADQIQTSDRSVFKDMERAFAGFLNSRKWTNDTYKNHEKINCTIFLNIGRMPSIGNFAANAQITAARPIFNTNYETVLLNFADREFEFSYIESQPMDYNDNAYINNLTSLLAFYAYAILAVDYDSFSEMGGNPYVQKMLLVVNNAQGSNSPGWDALGNNRSRYALLESMNNPQQADIRKGSYKYHRLALDNYQKDPGQSQEQILDVIKSIKKVYGVYPTSVLVSSFFDAKFNELANVFSEASLNIKREAYDLLTSVDPKRTVYQKIISDN
ncbi:DUF4835 domain-containing protein [Cytophagales bacterium WSM2-2]|nr:DUF4835 domain-containing protein [Cytophagales bacterium WSM2-2]